MKFRRWIGGAAFVCVLFLVFPTPAFAAPEDARRDDSFSWVLLQEEGKADRWLCQDDSGKAVTGWIEYEDKIYYLNRSGVMVTGWVKDGGSWYYLEEGSGVLQTNT